MKKKRSFAITIVCVLLISALTISSLFFHGNGYSDSERRKLAEFPELSADSIFSGEFTQELEAYATDHFPLRDSFRTIKSIFNFYVLRQKDNNGIYIKDGYAVKDEYPLDKNSVENACEKFNSIYEKYLKSENNKILLTIVPDKGYFLNEANGYPSIDYNEMISLVKDNISFGEYIDITQSLNISDYYKTDTHWKQENIIPVAEKLSASFGNSLSEENKTVETDTVFYGVYYGQASLPIKPDSISYISNNAINEASVYNHENGKTTAVYDMEKLQGKDPYEMFLSGSAALLTVTNENNDSGKKLIVFRDSFGSSLVPLLIESYSEITLIDTRYVSSDILGEYVDFSNSDVLFIYSTLILNSSYTLK